MATWGRGSPRGTRMAPACRSCRARFRVRRTEFKAAAARTSGSTSLVPAPTPMATRRSRPVAPTAEMVAHGTSEPSSQGAGCDAIGAVAQDDGNPGTAEHAHLVARSHASLHAPQRQSPQQVVALRLHARARRRLDVDAGDDGGARTGRPRSGVQRWRSRRRLRCPFESLSLARRSCSRPGGGRGQGRCGVETPLTAPSPKRSTNAVTLPLRHPAPPLSHTTERGPLCSSYPVVRSLAKWIAPCKQNLTKFRALFRRIGAMPG